MPTRTLAGRGRRFPAALLLLAALAVGSGPELTGFSRPDPAGGHAAKDPAIQDPTPKATLALARIDKAALATLTLEQVEGLRSVLELRTSWLVAGPLDAFERLSRAGTPVEVIDRDPRDRWFEVTVGPRTEGEPGRRARTDERGREARQSVVALETDVWIRAAADQAPGPATPPGSRVIRISAVGGPSLAFAAQRVIQRVPAAQADVRDDPRIAALAAEVSADRLRAGVEALQSFQTRDATTTGSLSAANFLYDYFRGIGLATRYEDFTFAGTIDGVRVTGLPATNIVVTIPGTVSPEQIVVVGAHYDSFGREQTRVFAPGADDNASGSAALMEIGLVLSRQPCDFTVRIVAFGAEEYGLHGSRVHAVAARAAGEHILAVLNLDMIGFTDRVPEDLDVVVDTRSEWLAARYIAVTDKYAPLPTTRRLDPLLRASDHAPFWDNGYSAMLGIEDAVLNNPYYHRATDRVETLNFDFASGAVRATLAVAADLAQPSRTPAPPLRPSARTSFLRSLVSRVKLTELSWSQPSDRQAVGYHVYRSVTPHGSYQRVTGSPVTATSFTDRVTSAADQVAYYVVTAVDAAGRESNYSVEVDDGTIRQ